MRRLRLICLTAAVLGGLALGATSALAESPVIVDCKAHDALTHQYSVSQLKNALNSMPSDVKEYTVCLRVIDDQLFADIAKEKGKGHVNTNGSGGSSFPVLLVIVLLVIVLVGGGLALAARRRAAAGTPPSDGV